MKATFKYNQRRGAIVDWSPALDAYICQLWADGWSAGMIAENICIPNGRQSVMGRLDRLNKVGKGRAAPVHKVLKKQAKQKLRQEPSYHPDRAAKMVDQFGALTIRSEP